VSKGNTVRWSTVSATVRGSAHETKATPNEDAVDTFESDDLNIVAVGDGHGSDQVVRAHRGSALAVQVALDTVRQSLDRLHGTEGDVAAVVEQLGQDIVVRWRAVVLADAEATPLTDDEAEALGTAPLEYAYGTTILCAGCSTDYMFAVQLGDGHIVTVDATGKGALAFSEEKSLATETNSLCMHDAGSYLRTRVWPINGTHPLIVAASSDGWGDAFEDRLWFESVGRDIHGYVNGQGLDHVAQQLGGWLERTAREFGDDTTMALLVQRPVAGRRPPPPPPPPEEPEGDVAAAAAVQQPLRKRPPGLVIGAAAAVALVVGIVAGSLLFGGGDADIAHPLLWTNAGLVEVAGDRATLVAVPAPVTPPPTGPNAVVTTDVVWRVTDGALARVDANATTAVPVPAGVGPLGSMALDGGRVLVATRSGDVVVVVDPESCNAAGCVTSCIAVFGADGAASTSVCDQPGQPDRTVTGSVPPTGTAATKTTTTVSTTDPAFVEVTSAPATRDQS